MKICNTCGFECDDELTVCPTCGRNCDGSDNPKNTAAQTDPFAEYRKQIDQQMKEQAQRIEAIKKQMQEEQDKRKSGEEEKPVKNNWDKTALFSEEEVKEYRLTAVLIYLLGIFGIILALVTDKSSPYLKFHITEELKITVITSALAVISVVLSFTFVVPVLCAAGLIVCTIINLISAYKTLKGKSENAVIIRNLKILN